MHGSSQLAPLPGDWASAPKFSVCQSAKPWVKLNPIPCPDKNCKFILCSLYYCITIKCIQMYHLPQNTGLNRVAPNTYIQGGKFKRYKYPFSSPRKWLSFTIGWSTPAGLALGLLATLQLENWAPAACRALALRWHPEKKIQITKSKFQNHLS